MLPVTLLPTFLYNPLILTAVDNPQISQENKDRIAKLIKISNSWKETLKIEEIKTPTTSISRLEEIKRMFLKEIERNKKIIPKQFFRNNIWQEIEQLQPLPPLEDFECNEIRDMKKILPSSKDSVYEFKQRQKRIDRLMQDKIKLTANELFDLAIKGKC